MEDIMIAHA